MAAYASRYRKPVPQFRPAPVKPDHTNQLDLFGNLSSDAPDDPPRKHDPEPLAEVLPAHASAADTGTAGDVAGAGGAADGGPAVSAPVLGDVVLGGLGDGDDGMGIPADRGPPIEVDEPGPVTPSRDFRITPAHGIGKGSLHEKARHNLAAIRTLKRIEAEAREATDDEKAVLARYAGWGAMPNAFGAYYVPSDWKQISQDVRELLTDEEYRAAQASTPNAHFTSPVVISAMWDAMQHFGVKNGANVLEPAMGVGHFLGMQPIGGKRTGVELDDITARIAKQLYPDSTIFHKGFEETSLPDNYFDVAIGNVPFGDYGVHDPAYKPIYTRAIHDYFFAKSIDKVRPGGILAFITSRYTMDKKDDAIRRYLSDKADLIGAIRLPNTAFKENAGTEVVTDIVFLQKRPPGTLGQGETWRELDQKEVPSPYGAYGTEATLVNEYFVRHPEMMLGTPALKSGRFGRELTVDGEVTPDLLSSAVARLPGNIYQPKGKRRSEPKPIEADESAVLAVKDGAFAEHEGQIVIRHGSSFEPANLSGTMQARVRGMMQIRDAVREVFRTQLEDAPEEQISAARHRLNLVYDAYARKYGPLSSRENIRAYAGDPDQPLLLSLEHYNPETKTAAKTAIFDKRTLERYKPVEKVGTATEALAVSLNETGGVDWPRMRQLSGKTEKQLQRELGSMVYLNPEGEWETADQYLSGDVRAKLRAAESAAALDPTYQRNIDALKTVQPKDLEPGEIEARLGASWIPASDLRQFLVELLDTHLGAVRVAHSGAIASWTVDVDHGVKHDAANTTTYGTARAKASELIEDALNGRTPTIYDQLDSETRVLNQQETLAAREKQQQLKDKFREWVWQDPKRAERLARDYNDRFNNLRLRTYDGSHLTLPGMNRSVLRSGDLDKHQKDAVWRIVQTPTTMLAHVVGAGKSFCMSASCMELRRLGLAKKPMIVVPNHLVEQMGTEFLKLYPTANLFIAGNEHFSGGNRQKAMARIATGNYDAVIVSHKSFELLPVSDESFQRFMEDQVNQLENAIIEAKAESGDNRNIIKELEKAKKRFVAKMKKRADRENKDNTLTFEELGVDYLFVDEADLFKNLGYVTKMNRIAGLPNSDSNRAFDIFMKTRYVRQINDGRGVVFATGTPISNTMAEMYTLLRYLAPELLEERGVEHFDAWAANFGEAVTALELAPDGSGYRMHTRFAKFINLPELLSMFRSSADVQTADMLSLPRPQIEGGKPHVEAAPASTDLKAFVPTLVTRAERIRNGGVDPRQDNMLKVTGDGRKAALDMRLVMPDADCNGDTKLNRAIGNIHRIWDRTKDQKSTQLVFCDLSTPSTDRWNVYDEVRDQLIQRGVPAGEIAYIHDAETDAQKKLLFDAVNAGRVRVLLGSTEKMGAGTNVQRRLIALHHLDAPWRPRDIEQREGRILRQGNLNPEVGIYRYVTEGSFDAYMWQTLETKARFIQQVMNGSVTVRQAEDLEGGALTYAEIKAIASGNPAVMEKVKVDTEIRKLDTLRSAHKAQQYKITSQIHGIPHDIKWHADRLEKERADMATRDAHKDLSWTMRVGNREFSGDDARKEAGAALNNVVMSWRHDQRLTPRAQFKGFEILSQGHEDMSRFEGMEDKLPRLFIRGAGLPYEANLNPENPLGTIQSLEHALRALDRYAEHDEMKIQKLERQLEDYRAQSGKPFEHEEKLKELLKRQADLNKMLDLDKNDAQVAPDDPVEEKAPSFVERVEQSRADGEHAL